MFYDTLEEMTFYYRFFAHELTNQYSNRIMDRAYTRAYGNIAAYLETDMQSAVTYCWRQVLYLQTWLSEHEKTVNSYERFKWMESVYREFLVCYVAITHDVSFTQEKDAS